MEVLVRLSQLRPRSLPVPLQKLIPPDPSWMTWSRFTSERWVTSRCCNIPSLSVAEVPSRQQRNLLAEEAEVQQQQLPGQGRAHGQHPAHNSVAIR